MGPDQNSGGLFTDVLQHETFGYVEADPLQRISDVALFLKRVCTKNALCSQSGHCGYFTQVLATSSQNLQFSLGNLVC